MRELLFIALVLACPLMMILMMRGGHGHGGGHGRGGCHGGHTQGAEPGAASTDDLRRRRDELDRLIEEHEQDAERELAPSGRRR